MQKMPNLTNERRLNQILMAVKVHVETLGVDNGYNNNSYNFGVNIPNIVPLNEIFKKNIISYLEDNPN